MSVPVRILVIEDLLTDFELAQREIRKAVKECEFQRVETRKDFLKALETFQPDLILSDYSLPRFDGMKALKLTRERASLTPLIIWTGSMSEDTAAECMKAGANNYVLKENIKRLGPAVTHGLEERRLLLDRKQAEEKLRESEERYRALFEQSHDGIFIIDLQGRHLDVNQRAADMLGYTTREMMGLTVKELSAEAQQSEQVLQRLKNGEQVPVYERLFRKKDGSVIPVEVNVELVRDAHGTPLHMQSVVRDITERKQAGEALINSEKRFRALIENGLDDISLLDTEGRLLWESPAVIRNLGYARNAFRGRNIFELMHPDDLEWTSSLYSKLTQQPGDSETGMFRLRHSDGTWRWFEAIVTNMLNEPSVKAIVVNYRDITERKQADEKLRESESRLIQALAGAQMSVWEWDLETNNILWSPEFFEITGVKKDGLDSTFESFTNLIHPQDANRVRASAQKALAEESMFAEEFRIIRPDGELRWLSNLGRAEHDAASKYLRLIGTVQDITQRKQAELERQALLEIMQGVAQSKDLQEFLKLIHRSVAKVIYAENFFVSFYDKDTGIFEEIYAVDQYDPSPPPSKMEKSLTSYVFRTGEPILLTRERFDELISQGEVELYGTYSASWMGAPLKTQKGIVGVMAVQDYENLKGYSESDKEFLASIGSQVALAIERKQAEEIEREQRALAEALLDTAETLNSTLDYGEVLDHILNAVERVVPHEAATIMLIDEGIARVVRLRGYAERGLSNEAMKVEFSLAETDNLRRMFETGQPVVVSDTQDFAGWKKSLPNDWVRSNVGAPIAIQGEVIGFILLDSATIGFFTPVHAEHLNAFANQAAIAIYNARLLHQAQKEITQRKQAEEIEREQRALAEALLDTAATLNSTLNYGEVLDHILNAVERVVPHEAATIMLINDGMAHAVRLRGHEKRGFDTEVMQIKFQLAEAANLRQILETRQPLVISDTQTYPAWINLPSTNWIRSNVGAPIIIQGEVNGFILLDSETSGFFTAVHAERLNAFANQAAIAIHNARLLQQAQEEITERKHAEEALRASEEKYRMLFEGNPQPMWIYDLDTLGFLKVNAAAVDQYGYAVDEFMSMTIKDIRPSEDLPRLLENIAHAPTGIEKAGIWQHRKKDGTIIQVEIISHTIEFEGRWAKLVLVNDVTEREKAEAELHNSEERFRQLADNIEEVFWMTDIGEDKEETTYISPAAERVWGRATVGELLPLDGFMESIWPEDRGRMLDAIERQRKGEKTDLEYRIIRPDGSVRWIWDRAFPIFDDAGKVVRLAGIAADITERKILERERNLLADTIAASLNEVYLFDANTLKFNFANNGALKNLGYTLDEILHLTPLDLKPKFNLESFQQLISPLLNNEKQAETFETVHRRADGSIYPIEAHLQLFERDSERVFLTVIQDITERKQAETTLRESQLRFAGIVNSAMDAIISADSDQRIVLFNPAAEKMFGFQAADAIGQPLERFIPQRYRVAHQRHVSTLETPGLISRAMEKQDRTLYGLRTDGKEFPLEASISHIEVAGQHLYTAVVHDITKRKEAEEALRASEERYRAVAELVSDYAYSYRIDPDGDMQQEWVTDAFHRITGYDATELRGAGEWRKLIHPDDLDLATRHVEMIFNGQQSIVEYRIIDKSGQVQYLRDFAQPVWDKKDNRIVRMIGAAQNITEQKLAEEALRESEERFGAAFELAPIGIALVSLDGRWLKVNRALCDLTGFTDQELLARTFLDITHPEDQTNHLNNTGQLLRGEINSFQLEKRYFHKLGHIIWILLSVSIVKDGQGNPQYFVSQIQDITERKQSEKEITRHLTEFTALYENGLAVGRLLEPREIGETIIETFSRQLSWHHVTIRLRKEASDELELVAFNLPGLKEEDRAEAEKNFVSHVNRVDQGMSGWVVQTGLPIRSGNVRALPQYVDTHEGIRSGLYMPLRVGERVIGVIGVESEEADAFSEQDQRLLATLANQAAIAFENARLFQAAQQELIERKRVEFELRDSQERFQDLFENSPVATWLEDFSAVASWMDGLRAQGVEKLGEYLAKNPGELKYAVELIRVLNVNHAAVVSNGASNKRELIDTVHDLLKDETVYQVMVNELEMIWNGLPSFSFEMSSHKLDGSNITGIQHFFIPTKGGRPDLGRVIVTNTDISDRISMEQALLTSEAHYRELADSITDVFFELDHNLNFSHWNRASEALTGIPAKDAIGKSLRDILEETREIDKVENIYQSVLRDSQPKTFETIFTLKHERRFFEVNAYPSMRGVSVVAKDVTDRKRVEAILEKRFELMEYSAHHSLEEVMQRAVDEVSKLTNSEIGFFHFMEADQITPGMQTWSTEAIELFKVPLSEGQHLPVDQAGVWAEALRLRGSVIQNDYESLPDKKGVPKGHVMITREMVIPIIRNEKIVAAMGIGNKVTPYTQRDLEIAERFADYAWDITERKEMEITLADERNQLAQRVEERTADLSRANSNLARALRVKDEFLANMSHELRTPLNAILGLSESLAEQTAGPLNEKQIRYISTIGESGHHLLSLINDILDLAKIEAGQITLDITKVDVNAVCRASLRMIKNLAQKKNQDVLLEIDEGLGLIWADERRLKQMMVNLLSNAVKFTPEGGTLGLEVHSYQEDNKVTITAWDNGIGISQRDLNQLFLPFVQLDSGLAREATGTGLGLALVAQMARLHGGGVTVTSQPGQGSRFTIMLPWEPALPVDIIEAKKVTGRLRPLELDDKNKPTILLIEDTQEVTMMISDYLEMNGYKIVTAQDGVEGIAQAKNTHPDLILMDIMMPRMDGLKATRKLRSEADFKHTPIIGLTALAMPEDRNRCIEAGMDDYISKPVNLKALVKIIQKYLSNAQEIKPL